MNMVLLTYSFVLCDITRPMVAAKPFSSPSPSGRQVLWGGAGCKQIVLWCQYIWSYTCSNAPLARAHRVETRYMRHCFCGASCGGYLYASKP